jgi:peptidyl-prolyl cis-trans isomerase B (cyclophilin B)
MKKIKSLIIVLAGMGLGISGVRADEVAVVSFRVGKDKMPLSFALEFYEKDAPATVANFKKLAEKKFYQGQSIHRAFPHLLVQMGDPLSKRRDRSRVGTGGPGYTLPAEIRRKHVKGAIAAARLPDVINPSRHSNGSQFYVCLADMPTYDGQYTVFGKVIWGLETLDGLSQQSVDSNDNPMTRNEIISVRVMPREALGAQPVVMSPIKVVKKRWWKIF